MNAMVQNLMPFNKQAQTNSTESKKGPPVVLKNLSQPEEVNFRDLLASQQKNGDDQEPLKQAGFKQLLKLLKLSPEELKGKLQELSKEELQAVDEASQMALLNILNLLQQVDKNPGLSLEKLGLNREGLQQLKERLTSLQQILNSNKINDKAMPENNRLDISNKENISHPNNNKSNNTNRNTTSQGNKVSVQIEDLTARSTGQQQSQSGNNISDVNKVMISETESSDQSVNTGRSVDGKAGSGLAVNLSDKEITASSKNDFRLDEKEILTKLQADSKQKAEFNIEDLAQKLKTGQADDFNNGQTRQELLSQLKSSTELKEMGARLNNQLKGLLQNQMITHNSQNSSFNQSNQFSNGQQFNFAFGQTGAENTSSAQGRTDILAAFGTENPVDQIMDQLQRLQKSGQKGLKLQLEPEFLGKVNLDLKVNSGEVSARLVVDNILVKNHLDQNISLLKNNLVNQGFNVENLEIETNNNESNLQQDGNGEQFDQQQYDSQNQNRNYGFQENPYQELDDLNPDQLREIAEMRPQQLQNWEMTNRHNWLTLSGYYQQMNILA